jgi:hypothetical protein
VDSADGQGYLLPADPWNGPNALCQNGSICVFGPSSASRWLCRSLIEPAGLVTHLIAQSAEISGPAEVSWALVADPHISADAATARSELYPSRNARAAIAEILESDCQAALIAGDLAWDAGLPADYTHLRAILAPLAAQIPVCLMLGNHDSRSVFLTEFAALGAGTEPAIEKSVAIVEHGPIRWILLDSLLRTDIVPGLLGKAQRGWLRAVLEGSDERPTLIVVHHPLDEDDDSLLDGDRLFHVVEPFRQVKAILTAHDHAFRVECRAGIHVISLPALGMPFDEAEPIGWIRASVTSTAGVFEFHAVGKNRLRDRSVTTLSWR